MSLALCRTFAGAQTRLQLLKRSKKPIHHRPHSSMPPSASASASLNYPVPFVSKPKANHTASVLWLHGLGDTGAGWSGIGPEFQEDLQHVKFVFPNAPQRPITLNWGMQMPGWYDIASLEDINQAEDAVGLHESKRYIEQLIQSEVDAGIPSERVVVAGFSQGGAMALMMLRSELKLAAIIGLSSYLPLREQHPLVSESNKQTPVLMCHGDQDKTVAYHYGQESYSQLRKLGVDVEFITYRGMAHSASPAELKDVLEFLKSNLKEAA